jgi:hypothetical protein
MANKPVKRKTRDTLPPPLPPLPNEPDTPYDFSDFVRVVQKDFYYGRSIHRIVKWGQNGPAEEIQAEAILAKHVKFDDRDLKELGVHKAQLSDKCSNNTKFLMLHFTRYT